MPGHLCVKVPLCEDAIQAARNESLCPVQGIPHPGQAADACILLPGNNLNTTLAGECLASSALDIIVSCQQ